MSNKLIFYSVFNLAGLDFAKNHITSLLRSGIPNSIIRCYVTDTELIDLLKEFNITVIYINDINSTKTTAQTKYLDFSSTEFNKLCIYRYAIALHLLENGFDAWYMDIDTVLLQNVLSVYNCYKLNHDVVTQTDLNMPCTGCMIFYNTTKTIQFLKIYIETYKNQHKYFNGNKELNDQMVFYNVINNLEHTVLQTINFQLLPWDKFPCGLLFFRELKDKAFNGVIIKLIEEFDKVRDNAMFVHANWMVGTETKIEALKKYGCWYI